MQGESISHCQLDVSQPIDHCEPYAWNSFFYSNPLAPQSRLEARIVKSSSHISSFRCRACISLLDDCRSVLRGDADESLRQRWFIFGFFLCVRVVLWFGQFGWALLATEMDRSTAGLTGGHVDCAQDVVPIGEDGCDG